MHIHGNSMNINAANFYSVGNGERSAAAQRAAETRKRILKSAASIDADASPEEALLIGQWLNSPQSQTPATGQHDAEYHTPAYGRDSDFG